MYGPLIFASGTGHAPSLDVIKRLRKKAIMKGLISDWTIVQTLNNGDLILNLRDGSTGPGRKDDCLIASKRSGSWRFYTETEYDFL
jgi:hypothetical protein